MRTVISKGFGGFVLTLILAFLFIFTPPLSYSQTPDSWPENYAGTWKLSSHDGKVRYIHLYKDREAVSTFDHKAKGQWLYHPDSGEIRVQWTNEWADVMMTPRVESEALKARLKTFRFAPGSNPGDKPAEAFVAEKVDLNPWDYLGTWIVMDVPGHETKINLDMDNSAVLEPKAGEKLGGGRGTWTIEGGRFLIRWPEGRTHVLSIEGTRYRMLLYAAGTSLESEPSNVFEATRVSKYLKSGAQVKVLLLKR